MEELFNVFEKVKEKCLVNESCVKVINRIKDLINWHLHWLESHLLSLVTIDKKGYIVDWHIYWLIKISKDSRFKSFIESRLKYNKCIDWLKQIEKPSVVEIKNYKIVSIACVPVDIPELPYENNVIEFPKNNMS